MFKIRSVPRMLEIFNVVKLPELDPDDGKMEETDPSIVNNSDVFEKRVLASPFPPTLTETS